MRTAAATAARTAMSKAAAAELEAAVAAAAEEKVAALRAAEAEAEKAKQAAVSTAVEAAKAEAADSARVAREAAAVRIAAVQRGRVARAYAARCQRVERPRAITLAELREWANDLIRAAALMPADSWGFAHLGTSVSRTELDELQLEAARDHALMAHEIGLPLGDGAHGGSIRPLLVFDSHTSAEGARGGSLGVAAPASVVPLCSACTPWMLGLAR